MRKSHRQVCTQIFESFSYTVVRRRMLLDRHMEYILINTQQIKKDDREN